MYSTAASSVKKEGNAAGAAIKAGLQAMVRLADIPGFIEMTL